MFQLSSDFIGAVEKTLGPDFLCTDPAQLQAYGTDWTKVFKPQPSAVVFPKTTQQVSEFMALCAKFGVCVVPSGGRTGLAGGAVAARGEVVVSLDRMKRIDPVDTFGGTVRVQAGAVTQAVHEHCASYGYTWPVDFASKGSSHVGGNIATNAGGVRVLRYGLTRQWVLGLEVVLASGEILHVGGALEKNNTGLDLKHLFIGTEGTLGIVTEATLKLTPLPRSAHVMLLALHTFKEVLDVFSYVRTSGVCVSAYEFFTQVCLQRVLSHRNMKTPWATSYPYYVLVEIDEPDVAALESWLERLLSSVSVADAVMAQNAAQAAELWALREGISESLSATGFPHKNDISLPIASLENFCVDLETLFQTRYPGWEVCVFGHVGDGNLHVNVMKPEGMDVASFVEKTKESDPQVFALVQKHKGSISAEHGIGLLKKPYLKYSRTEQEMAWIRSFKKLLDPHNILNPGKIFEIDF